MTIELVRKVSSANTGGEFDGPTVYGPKTFNIGGGNTTASVAGTMILGNSGSTIQPAISSVTNADGNYGLHVVGKTTVDTTVGGTAVVAFRAAKTDGAGNDSVVTNRNLFSWEGAGGLGTSAGSISASGIWTLGLTTLPSGAFHQINGGLNIGGQTTTSLSGFSNAGSISNDTTYIPFIFVNTVVNSGASPRFQYSSNKAGSGIHGWGTDSSGQMIFGRGSGATGLIDIATYSVVTTSGGWTFGQTTGIAATSAHVFNGRINVKNPAGRVSSGAAAAGNCSVLGGTSLNFTNGIGSYDYDAGTDQIIGLVVITWSVNGTRGITVLYKVDAVLTQIAQSSAPSNLTFSIVSTSTGSGTGTQNAVRITSAAGNTGLSVAAGVSFIGAI